MEDSKPPVRQRLALYIAAGLAAPILGALGLFLYEPIGDWLSDLTSDPVDIDTDLDPSDMDRAETKVGLLSTPKEWSDGHPNWTPYFYYVPRSKAELTEPPQDCRERRDWAWGLGGADADETRMKLTLTGNRDTEVSIDKMSVEVDSEPLKPGLVAACPVGGATGETFGFLVDLERETVTFVEAGNQAPARFTLEKGKTEQFDIYAVAWGKPRLYTWRLKLSVVDGSDRRSVTVDDKGKPFRTAGAGKAGTPMLIWRDGSWRTYRP